MKKIIVTIGIIVVVFIGISLSSCTSTKSATNNVVSNTEVAVSGAQLWSNNCIRCHNIPSPTAYDDKEWDAIVNHMQKVAGLTVTDAEKVAEFMKSAN